MEFASLEGTRQYSLRLLNNNNTHIHPSHFRLDDHLSLMLSSFGMGTYLGNMDTTTDNLVISAIKASCNAGLNVFDTAINYRWQKGERSLGVALQSLMASSENSIQRDEFFISTKNGYIPGDADRRLDSDDYLEKELLSKDIVKPSDVVDNIHCMSPSFLEHQLHSSLKNLQLKAIDLIYLHNSAESQIPVIGKDAYLKRLEKAFTFYESQRKIGTVHFYGLATWDCFRSTPTAEVYLNLEDIVSIAKSVGGIDHGFKAVQLPINFSMPEAINFKNQTVNGEKLPMITASSKLGITLFASVPLMQGRLLTGRILPKLSNKLTASQTCLQLLRSTPNVIPLVGHKQKNHVKENLDLIQYPRLDPEVYNSFFS